MFRVAPIREPPARPLRRRRRVRALVNRTTHNGSHGDTQAFSGWRRHEADGGGGGRWRYEVGGCGGGGRRREVVVVEIVVVGGGGGSGGVPTAADERDIDGWSGSITGGGAAA